MRVPKKVVLEIPLDLLDRHPNQPMARETTDALRELMVAIQGTGHFDNPVVVARGNGRYTILNGHRRIAIARLLGYTSILCEVVERQPNQTDVQLYVQYNTGTRRTPNADWFQTLSAAPESEWLSLLSLFPKVTGGHIKYILDCVGPARLRELAAQRQSPNIVNLVRRIVGLNSSCVELFEPHGPIKPLRGDEVLNWLVTYRQQNAAVQFLDKEIMTRAGANMNRTKRLVTLIRTGQCVVPPKRKANHTRSK